MARDRKRAKQRQQRRGALRRGETAGDGSSRAEPRANQLTRADLPGALEHVGDVDEFDAALVRGAGGMQVPAAEGDGAEAQPLPEESLAEEIEHATAPAQRQRERDRGEPSGNGVTTAPVRAPARPAREGGQPLPSRAIAFLRASWAELQRVQWPNRAQVTQATAVVLGFVAVAGIYFGVADYVAKEIVEAIL